MMKIPDKIEMLFSHFKITGVAKIRTWYNEPGYVTMEAIEIRDKSLPEVINLLQEDIRKDYPDLINDGGYDVQSIDGAYVIITAVYKLADASFSSSSHVTVGIPVNDLFLGKLTDDDWTRMSHIIDEVWWTIT